MEERTWIFIADCLWLKLQLCYLASCFWPLWNSSLKCFLICEMDKIPLLMVLSKKSNVFTSARKIPLDLPPLQHQIILEGLDNDTAHYQFQEIYRICFLAWHNLVWNHILKRQDVKDTASFTPEILLRQFTRIRTVWLVLLRKLAAFLRVTFVCLCDLMPLASPHNIKERPWTPGPKMG